MIEPARVAEWYANLTPESLDQIRLHYHDNAHFRDPFNDVRGITAIKEIFADMFAKVDKPKFVILDIHSADNTAWISWSFSFKLKGRDITISGSSRLDYDPQGQVISHIDYWDGSELLAQLPMIGKIVRWTKLRLRARQD